MQTYQDAPGGNGDVSSLAEVFPAEQVRPLSGGAEAAALDGARCECEEVLIVDQRASLGPAQWVEHKLTSLLGGGLVPVSHVRMLTQLGRRSHC